MVLSTLWPFLTSVAVMSSTPSHRAPAAGIVNERQVLLHLQRVVHGDLRAPADPLAQRTPSNSARASVSTMSQRARLVVEEVVVGAEEMTAGRIPCSGGRISSAMRAGLLSAVLPLVVGGNGAVRAVELAAEGQHERADRAVACEPDRPAARAALSVARRPGGSSRRYPSTGCGSSSRSPTSRCMPVSISSSAGHSIGRRGRTPGRGRRRAAPPSRARMNAERIDSPGRADRQQHLEQAQQHVLLAGDRDVSAARLGRVGAEKTVGLVDRMRTAGDDQRAVGRVDPPGVANQLHALLGVQAHARDHEQVGHPCRRAAFATVGSGGSIAAGRCGSFRIRHRAMAEPMARTPAGAIRVSAKMNGSIRVR